MISPNNLIPSFHEYPENFTRHSFPPQAAEAFGARLVALQSFTRLIWIYLWFSLILLWIHLNCWSCLICLHTYFTCAAICTSTCQNGGTCTAPEVCTCTDGWTGMQCESGMYTKSAFPACKAVWVDHYYQSIISAIYFHVFFSCLQIYFTLYCSSLPNLVSCWLWWSWHSHKRTAHSFQYNLQLRSDLHLWCNLCTTGIKQ